MNDNQINSFLAVIREGNFTKAAQAMCISQPAISKAIATLEAELGISLFRRYPNKRIELTQAGQIYANLFNKFNIELHSTHKLAYKFASPDVTQIRIACLSDWSITKWLCPAIEKFSQLFPNAIFSTYKFDFDQLIEALLKDDADAIITINSGLRLIPNLNCENLSSIQHVILYSDYFLKKNGLSADSPDFRDALFFIPKFNNVYNQLEAIRSYTDSLGFAPQLFITQNTDSAIAMAERGEGVIIKDTWNQYMDSSTFHHFPLNSYEQVKMLWKSDNQNQSTVNSFYEVLRDSLQI